MLGADLVVVPDEHADGVAEFGGERIGASGLGRRQPLVADLAGRPTEHLIAPAQRRGEDLVAETDAEHRDVARRRLADQVVLAVDEGDVLIGAVRAAGEEDAVVDAEVVGELAVVSP